MYFSSQTAQSGQSHTLHITKEPNGQTRVEAPWSGIDPVIDADERYAIQHMKRLLDEAAHQSSPSRPLLLAGGDAS
jgi:hypothetical protein